MWTLQKIPKRQRPHLQVEFVAHGPFTDAEDFRVKVSESIAQELAHFRNYYLTNGADRLARLVMHAPLANAGVFPGLQTSRNIAGSTPSPIPIIPANATLYQAMFGIVSPEKEDVFNIFARIGINQGLAKAWASYRRRMGLPRDIAGETYLTPKLVKAPVEKPKRKRRAKVASEKAKTKRKRRAILDKPAARPPKPDGLHQTKK